MAIPGKRADSRLIVRTTYQQTLYQRLGICPNPFTGGGSSSSIIVSFSGMPQKLSPLLGAVTLIADPNINATIAPETVVGVWSGWTGTVNAGGCQAGQTRAVFTRIRRMIGNTSAFVIDAYALTVLANGACQYVLVFQGGALGFDKILNSGASVVVGNVAYAGGPVPGSLDKPSGAALVALPS